MILYNIVDQIISSIDAGIRTDDSKFSPLRIEDRVDGWRQDAISMLYNGNRDLAKNPDIPSENFQQFDAIYDPLIQDKGVNYIKFLLPQPIALNNFNNGYVFLGNKKTGQNFTQVKDASYFANALNAKLIYSTKVYWFRSGDNYGKFWGNINLKTFFCDGVFAKPLLVPNFNPVTMEYPASEDVLNLIFKMAYAELMPQQGKVADMVNDARPIDSLKLQTPNG